MTKTDQPWTR